MIIASCVLTLELAGVFSLKEKRSIVKSVLKRLPQKFNVAVAEVDHHDAWGTAVIALVMVGNDNERNRRDLTKASDALTSNGHELQIHIRQGNVVPELNAFRSEHNIGLIVMGAYGHSRVRELFVGSNTSKMISDSPVPLLLLR